MFTKTAFLLTCYNRKEKTRDCLSTLLKIVPYVDVFIVDDDSSDGTANMIKSNFPNVNLINGNGSLFWCRGMYTAWKEALKGEYEFYIWLNDDIILYPFFYEELFACHKIAGKESIITGIIIDRDTKKVIYGGTDSNNKLIQVNGKMNPVRDMNGNVVLVPKCVVEKIGIIDPHYIQGGGDTDYGYTATENGIKVLTTRRAVAEGYANPIDRLRKWDTNIIKRYEFLYSPLGMNPRLGFYHFHKHFGIKKAFMYWAYLHIINILPDRIVSFLHKR